MENGHVTEVASLKEGEWSCYRGGQFNGERMVLLRRCPVYGGIMIMLERWSVLWRESGPYGGHQFKGWKIVMLQRLSL